MIAVIAGLLSVVCATTMTLGRAIFAADATGGKDFSMEDGWIAGVGGLLILLIVISFGRQMARENRTHLIRSLSHSVVEGVAMIASAAGASCRCSCRQRILGPPPCPLPPEPRWTCSAT